MTRCIVHIGMHKTGSTSIQHSLRGFSDSRFLYARLGDDPNHSLAMHSLFSARPEHHHLHKRDGADLNAISDYVARMQADLERAVSDAAGRTLIISGEDISALPRESLVKIRDDFERRFDDLTLVGYVRAPAALMTSSFQHRVSMGTVDNFHLGRQYRSYQGTFSVFDDVFGRERVNLWKFDIGSFPERCAVRDFCTRMDINLPSRKIVRLNESLSRQVVALLYTYYKSGLNRGYQMTGPERQKLLDCLAPIGSHPFRISANVIKPILDKNRADIGWMESRLGQSLHENIGGHQGGDTEDELDLLCPDPMVTRTLLQLLDGAIPPGVRGETTEEVARLVHALIETRIRQGRHPKSDDGSLGKRFNWLFRKLLG